MASTLRRLSEPSATCLMCSGRLSALGGPCITPGIELGSDGFAHELFVGERAVRFSGIKESDAAFDGGPNQGDQLLLVWRRAVGLAHAHAAEPDGRNFQIAVSKFALLHLFLLI